jgi:hypothetical protein
MPGSIILSKIRQFLPDIGPGLSLRLIIRNLVIPFPYPADEANPETGISQSPAAG